jgi:hypothetical protein
MYSAEGQSVVSDPSNYVAGVVGQGGDGYWYSMDANGSMYLWTTSGWQATAASAETGSDTVTIVGPPSGGGSINDLVNQAYALGDQAAIDALGGIQQTEKDTISSILAPGDKDRDGTIDPSDYDPSDPSVQEPMDIPDEPDPYDSDY